MITRNNCTEDDARVHKALKALDIKNPTKVIKVNKDIKKDMLVTALEFLNYLTFDTTKKRLRKILVDNLTTDKIEKV